jgi:hypothetical protein
MPPPRIRWFIPFLACLTPLLARGEDSVTFPLQGYYHPGRYMPVHVTVSPQSAGELNVQLNAPGAISTQVRFDGGKVDATAPWMVVDGRAQTLSWYVYPRKGWTQIGTPLKPLAEHQRLIGYAGVDGQAAVAIATLIFPGDYLIPVPLDPAQPMPGTPTAWETLDAAVLDTAGAKRVGEAGFASLVAQGVVFAVHTDGKAAAPWPNWPWKREGDWWVMRHHPAGPLTASYSEAVYEPVSSWRSGWPGDVRRAMFLYAVVFSILLMLLALWRPRGAVVGAVLISGAFLGGIIYWGNVHKPIQTTGGKIRIIGKGITQDDDWAYQTCHQRVVSIVRWIDSTRVMFASAGQLDDCMARIVCYPNGDPDFIFYVLPPKMKVALLSRRCGPKAPSATPLPIITSPLAAVVKSFYLGPGDRIVGEFPSAPLMSAPYSPVQQWPGLIVRRAASEGSQIH